MQTYYSLTPERRSQPLVRMPLPCCSEEDARAHLAQQPHPVDPLILCYSDADDA